MFPSLEDCRARWDKMFRCKTEWTDAAPEPKMPFKPDVIQGGKAA